MDDHQQLLLARLAAAEAVATAAPTEPLGLAERRTIVSTFRTLLEGLYTHLPQKRASYGFDPSQRLRLLGERAADPDLTDRIFHREMAQIITDLRDAHTRYLGPREHADHAVFLPMLVERYVEPDGTSGYVASKVVPIEPSEKARFTRAGFTAGVELTHWNGVKIARAVELHAEHETGGRPDARLARALESLTVRPLRYALEPEEDWVDLRFLTKRKAVREIRLRWKRVQLSPPPAAPPDRVAQALAYDPIGDSAREVKKMLFAGPVWLAEQVAAAGVEPQSVADCHANGWDDDRRGWLAGRFAANVAARVVPYKRREYGYLRIYSFQLRDDQAFIEEVIELLGHLPQDGLIVDVRANPGGLIWAAEGLLQLLTPNRISPTRFSLSATDMTRAMARARQNRQLAPWADSLDAAITTGVTHSRSVPLTPAGRCNNLGQHYPGPVVAIVDATTYSAGDLFAAGFVDNNVGKLICTGTATGGGGANVWRPRDVARALDGTGHELADLGDVSFTIAARRAERIGESGTDIEDTGVSGSFRHPLTLRDLTDRNADLITYAGGLLASETVTSMNIEHTPHGMVVAVDGIDRVTVEVDGVSQQSEAVVDGAASFEAIVDADQHLVEVVGYNATVACQRRRIGG
jgi:C-terminal processing protease CtpA/Prc